MSKPEPLVHGVYYHVYNRGNGGENIFREARNYDYFLKQYARYVEPVADTYAYCLLKNHFHLLVRIKEEEEIDLTGFANRSGLKNPTQQFSNFFNSYAKSINIAYGRTGNLFQRPFGRIRVMTDAYFVGLIHYIHFNPQKHGFVSDFREYPYSSYRAILSTDATKIKREEVLTWFSGRDGFTASHISHADDKKITLLIGEDPD